MFNEPWWDFNVYFVQVLNYETRISVAKRVRSVCCPSFDLTKSLNRLKKKLNTKQ